VLTCPTFALSVRRSLRYYEYLTIAEKSSLEGEIIRKCLARSEQQCSFLEYRNYKCIYRRYASLFFIVGVDSDEVGNNDHTPQRTDRQHERCMRMKRSLTSCFDLLLPSGQNELAILEFIHNLVETLDKYFENVCELDVSRDRRTNGQDKLCCVGVTRSPPSFSRSCSDHVQSRACAFHSR
jgi:hypothetical protein